MSANVPIGRFYNEMWNHFDKGLFPELLVEEIRFRDSLGQSAVGYAEFGQYVATYTMRFLTSQTMLKRWSAEATNPLFG